MSKGRPIKHFIVDKKTGTDFINDLEEILNDRHKQGWEFIRMYSLKVNEYNLLFKKIKNFDERS
jgi:hypothetical protein